MKLTTALLVGLGFLLGLFACYTFHMHNKVEELETQHRIYENRITEFENQLQSQTKIIIQILDFITPVNRSSQYKYMGPNGIDKKDSV